jgi:hypothetical protein
MSLLIHFYKQRLKKDLNNVKNKLPLSVYNFFYYNYLEYKIKTLGDLKYLKEAYSSLKCLSEHINWCVEKELAISCDSIFDFDGKVKPITEEVAAPKLGYAFCDKVNADIKKYSLVSDEELKKADAPIILIKDLNGKFILLDGYRRIISRFKYVNEGRKQASINCVLGLLKISDYIINIPMRDMNVIIEEFFNLDLPCPSEVPMCEKVRAAYKEELDKLMSNPQGCSQCAKNGLKSRFMESVWKEAISSITSKGS